MSDANDLPPLTPVPTGLYRHHKGSWYEVLETARCSETLQPMVVYRALYGDRGTWVRPASMFLETVTVPQGSVARFVRYPPERIPLNEVANARAVVGWFEGRAAQANVTLRAPPPEPTTCCGRGCNGCVWEGYYQAMQHWRDDASAALSRLG